MAKVLVFIDNPGQALKKASLELLTIARSLGEPAVAINGELHDDVAAALAAYGAQTLYRPSAADLDDYLVGPKASYLAAAVLTADATVVLTENSAEAKEIAARLGIKLGAGVITDVVAVDTDGTAHKSVLAGSYTTTAKATTPVSVLTVKSNSVTPEPAVTGTAPATVTVDGAGDCGRGVSQGHVPHREGRQRPPGAHRGTDRCGWRTRSRRQLRAHRRPRRRPRCSHRRFPRRN